MREEYIPADANGVRRGFFGRGVSWSATVAGLVVALVIQVLLTMLGVAIGAATVQPTQESNPVEGLGVGAGIWWFVTGLISLFVGAFVAGRLQGVASKKEGRLHGFLMWSTATVFTFMIAGTMMGGMFAGGFSAIAEPGNRKQLMNEFDEKKNQFQDGDQSRMQSGTDYDVSRTPTDRTTDENRVSPANPYHTPATTDPATTDQATGGSTEGSDVASRNDRTANQIRGGGDAATDSAAMGSVDRGDTDTQSGNTNLLNDDAQTQVGQAGDDNEQPVVGSREEAELRQTGEKVADTASKAALMGLLVLLIGAAVCAWAGSKGAPHDYEPPHERDARIPTGAIPGEPVKG
jgi:hypothetical protein